MKTLINGRWTDRKDEKQSNDGSFKRKDTEFRNWITPDGSPGETGVGGFKAESGRYHLYVSLTCPWAHRTLIFRKLKNLEPHIGVSIVHPIMLENGWEFRADFPQCTGDQILGKSSIFEVYLSANKNITSRASVPVLWDVKQATIVSNESSEIIRMFNSAFEKISVNELDLYPSTLRTEIDELNAMIYENVNNGVYKTGFATSQKSYTESFMKLFECLEELEQRLSITRFLLGDKITEADWRLFTTLVRFDAVYVGHFKCNKKRLCDYPNLWSYTRDLYQQPGVSETVDLEHIKHHYYGSHKMINPNGIIPSGPFINFHDAHNRQPS
ncbi:MAG: glutathione-dependent reductase [Rhodospirillaceae bacterium]|nr:glutathione-dependent reductase [Rhodospirillaceae bacterium]